MNCDYYSKGFKLIFSYKVQTLNAKTLVKQIKVKNGGSQFQGTAAGPQL